MAIADTRAWIEIDLDALRANYDTICRAAGEGAAMVPMVKADAYGLGAGRVVRALGVDRPVLVAGPLPAGDVDVAARAGLVASISSVPALEAWRGAADRAGRTLDFHVDVDTGMGRTGFDWREVGQWAGALASLVERSDGSVRWSGAFTHFHSADAPTEGESREQWERFRDTLVQLPVAREALFVHVSNSAGALRWPEFSADAVRPGIFLYGGAPAPGITDAPAPVVSVRARLGHVRDVRAGTTVGYGATHRARESTRWGTLTIGYGDGIPRLLGNRGHGLVRGCRVPIVGRISMDLTTVDLAKVPGAAPGDVATLIGADGEERITVDDVAEQAQTIGYEILVSVGRSRLPRIERMTEEGGSG